MTTTHTAGGVLISSMTITELISYVYTSQQPTQCELELVKRLEKALETSSMLQTSLHYVHQMAMPYDPRR